MTDFDLGQDVGERRKMPLEEILPTRNQLLWREPHEMDRDRDVITRPKTPYVVSCYDPCPPPSIEVHRVSFQNLKLFVFRHVTGVSSMAVLMTLTSLATRRSPHGVAAAALM